MIEVEITTQMIDNARVKAKELGHLRNSITKGAGNLIGFIGEEITKSCLGGELVNTYDYDLVLEDGTTVDVKTKATNYTPKDNYACTVPAYNTKQKCDAYAFVRVKRDLTVGWYLGMLPKEDFFDMAEHFKKGDLDDSGFVYKSDCYETKILDLRDRI
ncbi:MAG: hypothetical protein VW577_04345 [Pelagibacteraceae bacterium]